MKAIKDLREGSKHVHYEAEMLRELAMRLARECGNPPESDAKRVEQNALIEAFCVHARNLLEFLYWKKSKHANALLALEFFDDPSRWNKMRPPELSDVWDRVSCEIDHLTTDRHTEPSKKQWRFIEIANALLNDVVEFQRLVPVDKLVDEWRTRPVASICTSSPMSAVGLATVNPFLPGFSGATEPMSTGATLPSPVALPREGATDARRGV